MPGTIRVSVLEAIDLPEPTADGSVKYVTVKVSLGTRQFERELRLAVDGRIDSWNSDFFFLVTNLRDMLVVNICDNEAQCMTRTSIAIPSIVEEGRRDEFVKLKGGGQIHLMMSFVLTDEERRKIESMRLRVLKRGEQEPMKRTMVFQNVQPIISNEFKSATVPAVSITEVDGFAVHEIKDSQGRANEPLGFGSSPKPLRPMLMFDYTRAVGLRSRQASRRAEKMSKFWAADILSKGIKASIDDLKSDEQILREVAVNEVGFGSPEKAMKNSSVVSSRSLQRAAYSMTSSTDIASSLVVSPSRQDPSARNVTLTLGKIQPEVFNTFSSKGRDEPGVAENHYREDKRAIEGPRKLSVLSAEAAAVANSSIERSTLVENRIRNNTFYRNAMHPGLKSQPHIWDRKHAVLACSRHKDIAKFECLSGQGQSLETRPGPGARWAQKNGLETRWTSPEKGRQIARVESNGQLSDPFKARAKILKLIKTASGLHQVCGDDPRLEERHTRTEGIGALVNKIVGEAAILLVALFMIWPIPGGSSYESDG